MYKNVKYNSQDLDEPKRSGFNTWIICSESNSSPPTRWDTNSVSFNRINKIKVFRIFVWIKVPYTPSHDEKVEPV
ncbi:hypothetical protein Hanom_Chr06g00515331 [Helianthus anomalus]